MCGEVCLIEVNIVEMLCEVCLVLFEVDVVLLVVCEFIVCVKEKVFGEDVIISFLFG